MDLLVRTVVTKRAVSWGKALFATAVLLAVAGAAPAFASEASLKLPAFTDPLFFGNSTTGASILMAGLVKLPLRVVAAIGLLIIFGHNLLDGWIFGAAEGLGNDLRSNLLKLLYIGPIGPGVQFTSNGPNLVVLYSIIPWIGVMAAGYGFGAILTQPVPKRDRLCLTIGLAAIVLFLLLRGFNVYGDPSHWSAPTPGSDRPQLPAVLSFLNTSKYPASLLFLLMTLGPTIALIPLLEKARGPVAGWMLLTR